jgi:hypothetical protein
MQKTFPLSLLFVLISFIIQAQKPEMSYRITNKDTTANCYDVYFKSSEDLNNVIVVDYTITVVAPEGWNKKINYYSSPNGQIRMDKAIPTFKNGSKENDYLFFYSESPFRVTVKKDEEVKLFSFCAEGACGEPLRLIRGLSPLSKNTYTSRILDGADGPSIDSKPKEFDLSNSMNLFINNEVYEAYFGTNYGSVLACSDSYQLQKSVSKTLIDINNDAAFSYMINLVNGVNEINTPITLVDTLQAGQEIESIITPVGWTCENTNNPTIVLCKNSTTIKAQTTTTFTINVKATKESSLSNQAYVLIDNKVKKSNIVQVAVSNIPNCPENYTLTGINNEIIYGNQSPQPQSLLKQANSTLISNLKTTINNSDVNYRAGKSVVLSPGFSTNISSSEGSFLVEIGGCKN